MIHRWMRAFPGTKVIYFRTGYDYLVRKYTKTTNFGPPKFLDFFRCTKCRNFFYNFYNPLFLKKVNYFLKMSRDFFKETFFLMYHLSDVIMYLFSDTSYNGKLVLANIEI